MLTHLHAVDKLLGAEHALPPLPILQGQSAIEPPRHSPVGNAEEGVDEATVGRPEIGCQDTNTQTDRQTQDAFVQKFREIKSYTMLPVLKVF